MTDPSAAARRAEAAAWCKARLDALTAAIPSYLHCMREFPSPEYGDVCEKVMDYARALRADPPLLLKLGATTVEGHASLADALRQVQLLADWLAAAGREQLQGECGDRPPSVEDDLSGYVLVSELWPSRPAEFKRASDVTRFLARIPNEPAPAGIRNKRKGQRRLVNEADWHRYFREKDRQASELLDDEALQEKLADIEVQQAIEQEQKKRGK